MVDQTGRKGAKMPSQIISRDMITTAMKDLATCREVINAIICPSKTLGDKGVTLGMIRVTPTGCWSTINFPQWVKLENEDRPKAFSFNCTSSGEFLSWV